MLIYYSAFEKAIYNKVDIISILVGGQIPLEFSIKNSIRSCVINFYECFVLIMTC